MKAVVFGNPSRSSEFTRVVDLPTPVARPGQTLITVEFAGINYIDVMARRADPGYVSAWPFVPGLEVVGTVAATGSPDSPHRVGQRVAAFTAGGGLAEQAVADDLLVVPLPDGVDGATGAAAPLMLSTALLLLQDTTRFMPGETVLMHSVGGGLGSAIAQLVVALGGGRLVGTVSSTDKEASAKAAGWEHVLVRDQLLAERLRQAAPAGADVILDPLGTTMLDVDVDSAAPGARIVIFGNPGAAPLAALPAVGSLIRGNLAIGGFSISRLTQTAPHRVARALREALRLVSERKVDVPVSVVGGLESAARTHDLLAEGRSTGKYVLAVA